MSRPTTNQLLAIFYKQRCYALKPHECQIGLISTFLNKINSFKQLSLALCTITQLLQVSMSSMLCLAKTYLGPSQTATVEFFCESS